MAGSEQKSRLPIRKEIVESLRNPAALVSLGDSAVDHIINHPSTYEAEWFERLSIAVGALKDAIESKTRINGAAAELTLLLLHSKEVPNYISLADMDEGIEPSQEEIAAWAWGKDYAMTSGWFVAFVFFGVLALLIFAIVTFGFESPDSTTTKVSLSLGGVSLAVATSVLGAGLYQLYVVRGFISWNYKGYSDAEIRRRKFYKTKGWYAYTLGGIFIALSIVFVIMMAHQLLDTEIPDYSYIRLAFLASVAVGLSLFSVGVWPIVRSVVARSETDRRMGKTKYLASPRLLVAFLPILTGMLSLVINWLFSR